VGRVPTLLVSGALTRLAFECLKMTARSQTLQLLLHLGTWDYLTSNSDLVLLRCCHGPPRRPPLASRRYLRPLQSRPLPPAKGKASHVRVDSKNWMSGITATMTMAMSSRKRQWRGGWKRVRCSMRTSLVTSPMTTTEEEKPSGLRNLRMGSAAAVGQLRRSAHSRAASRQQLRQQGFHHHHHRLGHLGHPGCHPCWGHLGLL